MNSDETIEHILEAESELRQTAANLILSSSNYDQNRIKILLDSCEKLKSVANALESISPNHRERHDNSDINANSNNVAFARDKSTDAEFPLCFLLGDNIYKVGQSEQLKSDGTHKNWWKCVSIDEAEQIMDFICSRPSTDFRRNDIKEQFNVPEYRVDVVITALRAIGAVAPSERRGFYRATQGKTSDWISAIKGLPVRNELLVSRAQ